MTALGIVLLIAYALFGVAALCGVAVLICAWPLIRTRQYRRRVIGMLLGIAVMCVSLVVGQKLFDDVLNHAHEHRRLDDCRALAASHNAGKPRFASCK